MKKILGVLTLSAFALTAAGCGDDSTSATGDEGSNFPEKQIELIVPASAGGGTDATARALATAVEDNLGQSVGVVNKPGGSGSVGMTEGANAEADGYTVTMAFVELTMFKHLGLSPLTYDQFKPIGLINFDPAALTVPADAPYDTLEEFIAYAEENPGELNVGNAGTGSIWHIAAANLENAAEIELNHVPHEGAAPAVTALVGGHIDAVTVSPAEVKSQLDAGNLKTLAIMSDERSDLLPDVPTFNESGVEINTTGTWRGLTVPAETPDEVVATLEEAFMEAAQEEEFLEFMENNGLGIRMLDSQEFGDFMAENEEDYGQIIGDLGI
ncbi:ABC transporter substrate-binding protein [Planococcus rifietoensis]|uniref:ABC transporter substrate-binding protein n=1 Tax=Planococcus rifietoensis TaxID=200991 RepID=A0A0U2ZB42_9BACL|nr:tripartite tricarboxylate transporter substrate binding protein [Planococcus rifietoensis]ALS76444.1 ABC transporter substrate-binding protein [Planococcus rifietoensis]